MIDAVTLADDKLTWVCPSCQGDNQTKISTLELGCDGGPDVIRLPLCGACRAQTFLFRTWDGAADFPHRRVINALAEHLKASGRSHASVKDRHEAEVRESRRPALLADLARPLVDLTGRVAAAERQRRAEEARALAAEQPPAPPPPPPEPPAPEPLPPDPAVIAEEEGVRERALFEAAVRRRVVRAKASVNKRLCLPPGSEPPADELEAELGKPAGEFLG